jgi:hypothetical protein
MKADAWLAALKQQSIPVPFTFHKEISGATLKGLELFSAAALP